MSSADDLQAHARIRDAALRLFGEQGIKGTTVRQMAEAAGVSAALVIHHFGSKERLVLEVGRSAMAVPLHLILNTAADLSPHELLNAAVTQVAKDAHTPALLLQIWAGAQSDPALKQLVTVELDTLRAGLRTLVAPWCRANSPAIDPEDLGGVLIGLVAGYAVQRALLPGEGPAGYLPMAVGLLQAAMVTDGRPAPAPRLS